MFYLLLLFWVKYAVACFTQRCGGTPVQVADWGELLASKCSLETALAEQEWLQNAALMRGL